MLAIERLLEIQEKFGKEVDRIVPIELDGGALRLILHLRDGTNLRIAEQWDGDVLECYSYYWLTSANDLKIGWDNAPHHTHLEHFPHYKHVENRGNLQPSSEACLEEIMAFIRKVYELI